MARRLQILTLSASWVFLAGALAVTLVSQTWRDCAGDRLSSSEALAILGLIVSSLGVMVGLSSVISRPLRPIGQFVMGVTACVLTAGAILAVGLVVWNHHVSCVGG